MVHSLANEVEGSSLELLKISRLDMGVYLCIASNGVPPTVSKRIFVSVDCKLAISSSLSSLSSIPSYDSIEVRRPLSSCVF